MIPEEPPSRFVEFSPPTISDLDVHPRWETGYLLQNVPFVSDLEGLVEQLRESTIFYTYPSDYTGYNTPGFHIKARVCRASNKYYFKILNPTRRNLIKAIKAYLKDKQDGKSGPSSIKV